MTGLVTETIELDPDEEFRFRGYSIPELRREIPKAPMEQNHLPQEFSG